MKKMLCAVLIFWGVVTNSQANEALISKTMEDYWTAYSAADFADAARYILPSDLIAIKREILPVFLLAGQSPDPEIKELAEFFFIGKSPEERAAMADAETFIAINSLFAELNPQIFSLLGGSSIEILDILQADSDSAQVHYSLHLQYDVEPPEDSEQLANVGARWYVRVK